jgi:hypothetical protein
MKYTAAKLTGFCSWHVLHSCCYCHCYLRGWPSTTRLEFRCRCARLSRVCLIPRYVATAASVPTAGRGCTGLCTLSCRRQLGAWRCRRWTFCSRQHHRVTLLRMKFAGAAGARRASSPQLMPAASLLALTQPFSPPTAVVTAVDRVSAPDAGPSGADHTLAPALAPGVLEQVCDFTMQHVFLALVEQRNLGAGPPAARFAIVVPALLLLPTTTAHCNTLTRRIGR